LRSAALRAANGRFDQSGAGPVVELPVGDACRVAGRRPAVAEVTRQGRDVVGEEQSLLLRSRDSCAVGPGYFGLVHVHVDSSTSTPSSVTPRGKEWVTTETGFTVWGAEGA